MKPEGWFRSTVGEVTSQCDYGLSCGLSVEPRGTPILRMGNLTNGKVLLDDLKYVPAEKVRAGDLLQSGDLLLNRTNSAALVGKVGLFRCDAAVTFASYLFRLRTDPSKADPRWFAQLLGSPRYQSALRDLATPGVSQTNINREALRRVELLVPPLPEQRKIATILCSMDDAIDGTQTVIDRLQVLKTAMMAELLTRGLPGRHTRTKQTEIGEVPDGWQVASLEDWLGALIDYRGKSPPKSDSGVPLITAKNVRFGFIDDEPREFIPTDSFTHWMIRGVPSAGDVLFTTEAPLGNAAAVPPKRIALGQRLITLCPDRQRVDPGFFLWAILSTRFQSQLLARATGSTVKGIKQSVLRTIPLSMPPLEEQRLIGEVLDSIADRLLEESKNLDQLRGLKAAVMSILLTGEVRVAPDESLT